MQRTNFPLGINKSVYSILLKPLMGDVQEASELDARTTSADSFRHEGVAARLQAPS